MTDKIALFIVFVTATIRSLHFGVLVLIHLFNLYLLYLILKLLFTILFPVLKLFFT